MLRALSAISSMLFVQDSTKTHWEVRRSYRRKHLFLKCRHGQYNATTGTRTFLLQHVQFNSLHDQCKSVDNSTRPSNEDTSVILHFRHFPSCHPIPNASIPGEGNKIRYSKTIPMNIRLEQAGGSRTYQNTEYLKSSRPLSDSTFNRAQHRGKHESWPWRKEEMKASTIKAVDSLGGSL